MDLFDYLLLKKYVNKSVDDIYQKIEDGEIGGEGGVADSEPTPGSTHAVQSGGTYQAISQALSSALAASLPASLATALSNYCLAADFYVRNGHYITQPTETEVASYSTAYSALQSALSLTPVTFTVTASGSGASLSKSSISKNEPVTIILTPAEGKKVDECSATMGTEELLCVILGNGSAVVYAPAGVLATANIAISYSTVSI